VRDGVADELRRAVPGLDARIVATH
jgi:hypothetical protein